jgi:hypothetical protein
MGLIDSYSLRSVNLDGIPPFDTLQYSHPPHPTHLKIKEQKNTPTLGPSIAHPMSIFPFLNSQMASLHGLNTISKETP